MKITKDAETLELYFNENITAPIVKDLKEEIKEILEQSNEYSQVVANLSEVEYIDSTGITLIIGIYKSVEESGKKLTVTGAREEIKNLFSIIRLDEIFTVQ